MSKRYRQIVIEPCLNGFICFIGCQKAVFNSGLDMASALKAYIESPDDTEQLFIRNTRVFSGLIPVPIDDRAQMERATIATPMGEGGLGRERL